MVRVHHTGNFCIYIFSDRDFSRLWYLTVSCHFPIGILGQVWYLIVSIPDLCTLTYFTVILK